MDINCNFPEAQLNNTFELYNSRLFNSQVRKVNIDTTLLVLGDPNITVSPTFLLNIQIG